jgi:small-conductance mechanosensitive channel
VPGRLATSFAHLPPWSAAILVLGLAAGAALVLHWAAFRIVGALDGRLGEFAAKLLRRIAPPMRLGLLVVALALALEFLALGGPVGDLVGWSLRLAFVAFVGWGLIVVVDTAADLYMRRVPADGADFLARKHLTQVRLLRRIAVAAIGFVTFAAMLMTIPAVRQYGVSLFASAGVAGLVVGLAARPVLSNLIAGLQIAITQPIRLEDAVSVEGEFGAIEEITTTYVVVRLWDQRRLIVPLSYFMEKPFQNWTRDAASLTGAVLLYLDYAAPVPALRAKFMELLRESPLWDGKTAAVQVTDASPGAIHVRALVSARTPADAWDLRCDIREKLVAWLQETHPEALPKTRSLNVGGPVAATGSVKEG